MIFLPDDIKRTVIPNQIERIRMANNPNSLIECCLRGLYHNQLFYNLICANLPADGLPKKILKCVLSGPVTMCGNSECKIPLFTECHFSLMKKYVYISKDLALSIANTIQLKPIYRQTTAHNCFFE